MFDDEILNQIFENNLEKIEENIHEEYHKRVKNIKNEDSSWLFIFRNSKWFFMDLDNIKDCLYVWWNFKWNLYKKTRNCREKYSWRIS